MKIWDIMLLDYKRPGAGGGGGRFSCSKGIRCTAAVRTVAKEDKKATKEKNVPAS